MAGITADWRESQSTMCSEVLWDGPRLAQIARVRLVPPVSRKRDIKQFLQACREAGLTASERFEASDALHAEKEWGGGREDMGYRELVAWLREWKDSWRPS
jgi:hypothetical protein